MYIFRTERGAAAAEKEYCEDNLQKIKLIYKGIIDGFVEYTKDS